MPRPDFTEKEVAELWDRNARAWSRGTRAGHDAARSAFNLPAYREFVGDVSGRRVLDAGCGDGSLTRLIAQGGATVAGIDLSREMIRLARKEEAAAPLGIRYEVGSFNDLSRFAPGSFDCVSSFMALMDGPGLERALAQFFGALRPGGDLVFAVTHPCFHTRDMAWLKDGKGPRFLLVSRYFEPGAARHRWRLPGEAPFAVPRYPRTLSHYLNALVDAGFRLAALAEPRPPDAECERHPGLRRWREHAALFLYVRARKPQ